MRALGSDFYKVTVFLLTLLIIFTGCKKEEAAQISHQPTAQDSTQTKLHELMLNNQSDIEANINSLMKLIKEKEVELTKAQQDLKIKSAELQKREQQLAKIETEIKKFRNISYFILVIGLILIIIGLFLISLRQKPGPKT
jgi:peptidoglycan hydrolase CwlO-like protein